MSPGAAANGRRARSTQTFRPGVRDGPGTSRPQRVLGAGHPHAVERVERHSPHRLGDEYVGLVVEAKRRPCRRCRTPLSTGLARRVREPRSSRTAGLARFPTARPWLPSGGALGVRFAEVIRRSPRWPGPGGGSTAVARAIPRCVAQVCGPIRARARTITIRLARGPRKSSNFSRHLRWKLGVADGQHLVDEQDVGVHVDRHGEEAEPYVHARRVVSSPGVSMKCSSPAKPTISSKRLV